MGSKYGTISRRESLVIGRGAIDGMGAVVTTEVVALTTFGGNPAWLLLNS